MLWSKWKISHYNKIPRQCIQSLILILHLDNYRHRSGIVYNDTLKCAKSNLKNSNNYNTSNF